MIKEFTLLLLKHKILIPYEEAVVIKEYVDWKNYKPVKPSIDGTKVFKEFDLATIAKYIDWGPFFIGWEITNCIGYCCKSFFREGSVYVLKHLCIRNLCKTIPFIFHKWSDYG